MTENVRELRVGDLGRTRLRPPESYWGVAIGAGQKALSLFGAALALPGQQMHERYLDSKAHSERIQAEMPANEAKVGSEFLAIRDKLMINWVAELEEVAAESAYIHVEELKHELSSVAKVLVDEQSETNRIAALPADEREEAALARKEHVAGLKEAVADKSHLPGRVLNRQLLARTQMAAMTVIGHGKIANALIATEESEVLVPDVVKAKTLEIAIGADTQPKLLVPRGWLNDSQATTAEYVMSTAPAQFY